MQVNCKMRYRKKKLGRMFCAVLIVPMLTACGTKDPGNTVSLVNESKMVSQQVSQQASQQPEASESPQIPPRDIAAEMRIAAEAEVLALYEERVLIEQAVRTLVAERIESTSFVQVKPRERYQYVEVLIDEATGNPVLSEGIKAMLAAVSGNKKTEEILADTITGAASGVSDFLQGEVEGVVTDVIGIDIFSAADFLNKWTNTENMPVVLLQNIVEDQKADVAMLDAFMKLETMSAADIHRIAQVIYRIHIREKEISQITGNTVQDRETDYQILHEQAERCAAIDGKLLMYDAVEYPDEMLELTANDIKELAALQEIFEEDLQKLDGLEELSLGNNAIDYDVKGYQVAQQAVEQTGLIANSFLGNLLGGFAGEDIQTVADWVQQARSNLYNALSDYMSDSYCEVIRVKSMLDQHKAKLQWMTEATGDELYVVQNYVNAVSANAVSAEETQELLRQMTAALEKYEFDLSVACTLYECVLSENRTEMLSQLQAEKETVTSYIDKSGIARGCGYSQEEMSERYRKLLDQYVEMVDYVQIRGGATGGRTPGFNDVGGINNYGTGKYHAYGNQEKITLIVMMLNGQYLYDQNTIRFYYDCQGNLLCYKHPVNRVYYWQDQILFNGFGNDVEAINELEYGEKIYRQFMSGQ